MEKRTAITSKLMKKELPNNTRNAKLFVTLPGKRFCKNTK